MPQEVFDLWIAPIASDPVYGWPFSSVHDSLDGTRWKDVFAGRTLLQWSNLSWKLEAIPLPTIEDDTMTRIQGILFHCAYGIQTPMANLQDTKERFRACADFIRQNGCLPAPVIGVFDKRVLELFDGHHRMAALFHVGIPKDFRLPVWSGYSATI